MFRLTSQIYKNLKKKDKSLRLQGITTQTIGLSEEIFWGFLSVRKY